MPGLLSVKEAQEKILEVISPLEQEFIPLDQAAGRVLAEDVVSGVDFPHFANSSMDGFAVRAGDVAAASAQSPVALLISADIPAGAGRLDALQPGEAARIMTGAPIPPGADAVVPVEDTNFSFTPGEQHLAGTVHIYKAVAPGGYVRRQGDDFRAGDALLHAGWRLRAQDMGLLAMLGYAQVKVWRKPRAAIFATGDELVSLGEALGAGEVYDSNTHTLAALVEKYGGAARPLGIYPDNREAVKQALVRAAESADLIISTAGVSVGAFDFVRQVVDEEGRVDLWKVNMRPGKPLTFGAFREKPFFGLPGNPVSALIGFIVFVAPALNRMTGGLGYQRRIQRVELLEAVESDGRESFLRAVVEQRGNHSFARLTGHQGSGNLLSLVQANALLILPSGVKSLPKAAEVDAWLFDWD
ncbi:MAG: molybdopterin molybdotransferase MoeA [Chloroflexi bacterium]|nr:molybdopterin molybdotransferase MoeA [Chloroflexota bacterium]